MLQGVHDYRLTEHMHQVSAQYDYEGKFEEVGCFPSLYVLRDYVMKI